jgi:hypothetical protein
MGLENLRAHKLRSLLTMMGMIFGVAAVVAMLSIGAGAQQEVMAFIEQLGVRNLIVEAREAPDQQTLPARPEALGGPDLPGLSDDSANVEWHHGLDRPEALDAARSCCPNRRAKRRSSTA